MIFQNINFGGQTPGEDEISKMCKEHPGCDECPLKEKDMNIQGSMVSCVTGRSNRNT